MTTVVQCISASAGLDGVVRYTFQKVAGSGTDNPDQVYVEDRFEFLCKKAMNWVIGAQFTLAVTLKPL